MVAALLACLVEVYRFYLVLSFVCKFTLDYFGLRGGLCLVHFW